MAPYPLYPTSPASAMSSGSYRNADKDKDKGVNVQVLLRCRPFNEDELRSNAPQVITCNEARREVLANLSIANKQIDRAFTFDKVFGPQAKQKELYDQAITPIVNEVLEGFNCTIFAYGQTGTGKTHTMEGSGKITKNGEMPAEAGVIPRAVQQIFETLESQKAEYSMKVTHLELYNEEITDLLAPPDDVLRSMADEKQRKPLALMEDGKGGVLVRGLEEEVVYTATDIYNLLERGSAKRRTAETLLNKQSSRSHSIFSITIHIKEATPEGEELIKCGKLNLVDLAGSENVTRSGAREGRAREAGEINKSLLTLGRVITALVEHLGHVPYRDSKLTRLLRDSLGGRTKTCIIATVSPSVHCLEETLSTLDYANRAKSIKNKPEVNQKMMKSALIKDLSTEIERLKTDLHAAREKNGVFLPRERYYQEEAEKKAMAERIEQMESELVTKDKQSEDLRRSFDSQCHINTKLTAELHATQENLGQTQESLSEAKEQIKQIQYTVKEKDYMIAKFQRSENMLIEKASSLQSHLENVASDNAGLFSKIERKDKVESGNRSLIQSYHSALSTHLDLLSGIVTSSVKQQQQKLQDLEIQLQSFYSTKNKGTDELKTRLLDIKSLYCEGLTGLHDLAKAHEKESSSVFQKLGLSFSAHVCAMKEHLSVSVHEAETVLKDLQASLSEQEEEITSFILQQQQAANQSINATQNISAVIVEFFDSVEQKSDESLHSCRQNQHDQRLCLSDFEKQYEQSSKQEGDQLLENIGEMLAAMRARKVDFVQSKVQTLTNTIMENAENLEQSMGAMHSTTVKAKDQWQAYVKQAESSYVNSSTALIARQCQLKELSQQGLNVMTRTEQDWKLIQSSLQQLESDNRLVVDAIIKEGVYNNGLLLSNFEQMDISIQSDMQSSTNSFEESIDSALSIDKNMVESALTATSHSSSGIEALQSRHDSGIKDTKNESNHYLIEEFLEDKPTCLTPKLRLIDVPSKESIEALRAPSLEKLMEEFGEENSITVSAVETKSIPTPRETKIPIFADSSLLRDNRAPLANVN